MRKQAILPSFSAFVSASAGTGKTKTLIDKLLNLLLSGAIPSRILCLAFTKAAAAEILNRINHKLAEFATLPQKDLIEELKDLGFDEVSLELQNKARILFTEFLDEIDPLKIQTIHAFCQQLLLKFPFESKANLNFTLLTDNKINLLIEQSKNILLNDINNYSKSQESIEYLSWHIKEYSFKELLTEIISNRETLDDFFNLHQNLENALNSIDPNIIDENEIIIEFINNIPLTSSLLISLYNGGKQDISRANKLTKFLHLPKNMQIMLIPDYMSCFLTISGEPTKSILSKKICDSNPDLVYIFEEEQQRVYKFSKFFKHLKAINLTKSFIVLSYHIRQIYKQLKRQNNSLDYDDLIDLSLNLLNNSEYSEWINYKLDGGIEHILVDEAQDTSAKQWQIINKLSENFLYKQTNTIFIVGDAKQSIFSFQGAKPELFNSMSHNLTEDVLKIQLNQSFRSGRQILHLVDNIFNQPHIRPLVTEVEKTIEHKAYKQSDSFIELLPLVIDEENEDIKTWTLPSDFTHKETQTAKQQLAQIIAQKIQQELESGLINNPGDILILTRRRTNFITNLIQELRKIDIPTSGLDRFKLLDHPITLDIISLTNFLLCEADDLNLAIILKSPIFKLNEGDLLQLCTKTLPLTSEMENSTSLWDKLKNTEQHLSIITFLEELSFIAKNKTPFEFYFSVFKSTKITQAYIPYFYQETYDIIDSFLDLVSEYETENIASLQLFLNFLSSNKTEVKKDLSQNNNQVRIMTIHNAKGLQAKTVFLTDTTSLPSNSDTIISLNKEQLLWPGREKYYPDIAKQAKQEKLDQEYAEYLRLLYVALTRAEDRLIICGSAKNENISEKSWYSIIKNSMD